MKRRKLLLTAIAVIVFSQTKAQFSHSIGTDIRFPGQRIITYEMNTSEGFLIEKSTVKLTRVGLSYFPSYTLLSKNRLSFSIGMPVSLGLGFYSSEDENSYISGSGDLKHYYGKNSGARLAVELPLVGDVNYRVFPNKKNRDNLTVFFGGGYAYNHTSFKQETDRRNSVFSIDVFQPYFHGGIRFLERKPITIAATFRPKRQYDLEPANASWGIQLLRQL